MKTSFPSCASFLKAVAALACLFPAALIGQITVSAVDDTFIWNQVGSPNSPTTAWGTPGGAINDLLSLTFGSGDDHAYPLFRFNLSAYAGSTVTGDATFAAYATTSSSLSSRTATLYALTAPFDSQTATFSSVYGDPAGPAPWGSVISATTFDTSAGMDTFYNFTIPGATVQAWIDSPSTNYGFAYVETGYQGVFYFSSIESFYGPDATLTFSATASAIPEPSTYAAIAGALTLGMAVIRRRQQAKTACATAAVSA